MAQRLLWLPELEIGWFPVTACPYDKAYWENYIDRDASLTGAALTAMRSAFVNAHWRGNVIDIGVGGGRFVREHVSALGYDVNPYAVDWLKRTEYWFDPYNHSVPAITCWDSLEHIHNPGPLLANVKQWAFLSIPIYADCTDILRSKHFKKDEHCWYFTQCGLDNFMRLHGFVRIEHNVMEQAAGREQIESFAYQRSLALDNPIDNGSTAIGVQLQCS